MRLEVIPTTLIENPTTDDITSALTRVYDDEVDAVVLIADEYKYIQVPCGGGHIEYQDEKGGIVYTAVQVPLSECIAIFRDYSQGGNLWRKKATWFPYLNEDGEEIHSIEMPSTFIQVRERTQRKWQTNKVLLAILLGFVAVTGFCILLTILPLEEVLLPSFMLALGGVPWLIMRTKKLERFVLLKTWTAIFLLFFAILFTIGGLIFTNYVVGLISFSSLSVLLVGLWAISTTIILIRDAFHFKRESIEVEASRLQITNIGGGEASLIPALNYVYLDMYQDYKPIKWRDKRIAKALDDEILRVFVRYLPQEPRIHRISRIEIDK